MAWIWLILAGLLETGWAIGIKYSEGFSKPVPSIITLVLMGISFWLLSIAVKELPVGTAYAVWVGIGALGTAILGIFLFDEPATALRIGCLFLLLIAIAGLKLTSTPPPS